MESLKRFLRRQEVKVKSQKLGEISKFIERRMQNPSALEKIILPEIQNRINEGSVQAAIEILKDLGKVDSDYLVVAKKVEEIPVEEMSGIEDYIREAAISLENKMRLSDKIAEEVLRELQQTPVEISRESIQTLVNQKVEEIEEKIQEAGIPYFPFKGVNTQLLNLLKEPKSVKELSTALRVEKNDVRGDLGLLIRFNLAEEYTEGDRRRYKLTPKGAAYIVEGSIKPYLAKRIMEICENDIEREELETTLLASGAQPSEVKEAIEKSIEIGLITHQKGKYTLGKLGELYRQSY